MIHLPASVRVYLCLTACEMRRRSKRLEEGTYAVPLGERAGERRREITAQELGALLSGIDLKQATRRKR
jgi:hypothetical protein